MAKLQPYLISGLDDGLETDVEPFLLPDKAYPVLDNAYIWRQKIKKREGITLLGRLRRNLTAQAQTAADGTADYDIADILTSFRAKEASADLAPSTVVIRVEVGTGNETEFTDQGDGTFSRTAGTAYQIDSGTYLNYISGAIHIEWLAGSVPPNTTPIEADFSYHPSLPVMAIMQRETTGINNEQTIIFDQIYAYTYSGSNFNEFITGSTWDSDDFNFFQGENYTGSDSSVKVLFVTNFIADTTNNPMRYTDGTTWTDFSPVITGVTIDDEALANTTLVASYADTTANAEIIPGTVTITVTDTVGGITVIYTDPEANGTLKGVASTNTGTINYTTGAIALAFSPNITVGSTVKIDYQYANFSLLTARFLVPYYGRLLAFNTYEGTTGSNSNYFNRVRFSQIGSPTQDNAWVQTIYGKGGFIDAPINEEIISYGFYKSTLIVGFERSTWALRYQGEYGLPFLWEKVSSDYGTESQFSPVMFSEGILSVGERAIISSNNSSVARIDDKIPDKVFTFRNANNGTARVHGVRDYQKELVYWCYNQSVGNVTNQKFPNKTLVFNYKNNSWSEFRNSVTTFGTYHSFSAITWDRLDIYWDDEEIKWDDAAEQAQFPYIICGNQQGFVHYYGYSSLDEYSIKIEAVDRTVEPIRITATNHNLADGEIIYLEDITFIDTSDSTSVATDLNDKTFAVKNLDTYDADIFQIVEWDTTTNQYVNDYSYTPASGTGTYIGKGKITLLPKMEFRTKDFNPFVAEGKQLKLSYIDFLTNITSSGAVTINLYVDSNLTEKGNIEIGQDNFPIQVNSFSNRPQAAYTWNRYFSAVYGQYISIEITYNDDQMNNRSIYNEYFELNALMLWIKAGGRLV